MFEAFLLALALCVDTLVVSTSSAFSSKMSYRRGLLMAAIFAFFQGGFPLMGALLGGVFKESMESVDHWIAFGLLLLVGGKMIVDALRNAPKESRLDVTRVGTLCLLGVATSIDAFVIGIGLGLSGDIAFVLMNVAIIAVMTFLVALLGTFLGKRDVPIPERLASCIAGMVLVGLGVYTLVEHLSV